MINPESKMQKLAACAEILGKESPARTRLTALFEEGTFVELDAFTGLQEEPSSVVTGYGYVGDTLVYAFAQDPKVCGGALNTVHAQKIKKVYQLAEKTGCPVVGLFDSNGAKLSEANAMLNAYGEILAAVNRLSGVVPQVAVVLGPCSGTSALLAAGSDLVIASKKAELFLQAPFVTKAKGGSAKAGSAKFAAEAGLVSVLCEDEAETLEAARGLLALLPSNNLSPAPLFEPAENPQGPAALAQSFAKPEEAQASALAEAICDADSVMPILPSFGKGIFTAFGLLSGAAVGIIANDETNGELDADACGKAARMIRLCDAFSIPVISLVNTKGFAVTDCPCLVKEAAKLAYAYAEATTAKISVICGQAIGAAYIAMASKSANADVALAWPSAVVSALSPEAAVIFAHGKEIDAAGKDAPKVKEEYMDQYIEEAADAFAVAKDGFLDAVIDPAQTRPALIHAMEMLAGKRESTLPKKHANHMM